MDNQFPQILLVDEELEVLQYLSRSLHSMGFETVTSTSWEEAKSLLKHPDVQPEIILIEPFPKLNGVGLQQVCAEAQKIPVLVLTISKDPQKIVKAFKAGARDYIFKPVEVEQLSETIATILKSEKGLPRTHTKAEDNKEVELIFSNPKMERVHNTVLQIAEIKVPVLIQGETGVGKDVISRLIHQNSILRDKPFVKVNCAAMPPELVESELFGYRKGAFTGAYSDRAGKFEFANGGTVFLDEIGEFTPPIQAKLLQVLQEGRFTRLGSNQETDVDVRVIVATSRDLEGAIETGTFREDLYYRLNVVNIEVPPLRERPDEIPLLSKHFFEKLAPQYNCKVTELPKELEELFCSYRWPGNVRQLENLIIRYIVLQDAESIKAELESKMTREVSDEINETAEHCLRESDNDLDLKKISKKAAAVTEKKIIMKTLHKTKWNRWKAAKELKVSYKTLLTKIEQYHIKPPR